MSQNRSESEAKGLVMENKKTHRIDNRESILIFPLIAVVVFSVGRWNSSFSYWIYSTFHSTFGPFMSQVEWLNWASNGMGKWLFVGVAIAVVVWLTQNIISTGKKGLGWWSLVMLAAFAWFIARAAGSVFTEISSSNSIQDWDEE
ncbi:MAG: hypothetical protein AAF939_16120 [Planctomycetota bacterium]